MDDICIRLGFKKILKNNKMLLLGCRQDCFDCYSLRTKLLQTARNVRGRAGIGSSHCISPTNFISKSGGGCVFFYVPGC